MAITDGLPSHMERASRPTYIVGYILTPKLISPASKSMKRPICRPIHIARVHTHPTNLFNYSQIGTSL